MSQIHKSLADYGWKELTLCEQLGNIGSEVERAILWKDKNKKISNNALIRVLELFELTIADNRWQHRIHEIQVARDVVCDYLAGDNKYKSNKKNVISYFNQFAYVARKGK